MGSTLVQIEGNSLKVDEREYQKTPDLVSLITEKHPRPMQWKSEDFRAYKSFVHRARLNHLRIKQALLDYMHR